ncbi:MAG: bacillithiol system redox-active protein YtxJ [Fibrobacterales bacterium]
MVLQEMTELSHLPEAMRSSEERPTLIFKYSPVCPVSHYSQNEFNVFIDENKELHDKVNIYQVNVIGARPISQEIAASLSIKHESPQALLIKNGSVIWHDSHSGVNRQSLVEAIDDALKA